MNRGTQQGDLSEISFVKRFNKEKNSKDFEVYIKECNIEKTGNVFMVRVDTKQYSKLSNQVVMTRADSYLVESQDDLIKELLFDNDFYLSESLLEENDILFKPILFSGVSVKMSDSNNFQILKLTPESFKTLFGNYELGACASVYCKNKVDLKKNESVFKGWNTTQENIISMFKLELPILINLNKNIVHEESLKIFSELKKFANYEIKKIIDNNDKLKEIIFNGYHIYEEPYTATYFYQGGVITKLEYIPFSVTTGSGRSRGDFTIVLKPKRN